MDINNVCVVLSDGADGSLSSGAKAVVAAFRAGGYSFCELRVSSRDPDRLFPALLAEFKDETEIFAVVADPARLLLARQTLARLLGGEFSQGTLAGAGVISSGRITFFLTAAEAGESGAGYVKNVCIPLLDKKYSRCFDRIVIRAVGAGEETVRRLIGEAARMSGDKLRYTYRSNFGEDVLEIAYDSSVPKMLADGVLRIFAEGLGEKVYALDDTPLEMRLVQLLKLRGRRISVAESFTGGGIGRRIVSVPGASEVYSEGLNTYSERSKMRRLGVSEYTLKTFGAVSDETAYEMAAGLIAAGDCDLSLATTGLAGPKSDRSSLPVGLCYVAVGTKEKVYVYRYRFEGGREAITEKAINYALFLAYRQLKKT